MVGEKERVGQIEAESIGQEYDRRGGRYGSRGFWGCDVSVHPVEGGIRPSGFHFGVDRSLEARWAGHCDWWSYSRQRTGWRK